jgi:hypothetical protein
MTGAQAANELVWRMLLVSDGADMEVDAGIREAPKMFPTHKRAAIVHQAQRGTSAIK